MLKSPKQNVRFLLFFRIVFSMSRNALSFRAPTRDAAMGRKSRHTDEKRNVPNKGEPVGTKKRNYTTKYYPNKSEWVPVSVKMSISSVSRCSQTSNQSD